MFNYDDVGIDTARENHRENVKIWCVDTLGTYVSFVMPGTML